MDILSYVFITGLLIIFFVSWIKLKSLAEKTDCYIKFIKNGIEPSLERVLNIRPGFYTYRHKLKTLQRWRSFSPENFLILLFEENKKLYNDIKDSMPEWNNAINNFADKHNVIAGDFQKARKNMKRYESFFINREIVRAKRLYSKRVFQDPIFTIIWTYTSPKGRNHYQSHADFKIHDVFQIIRSYEEKQTYKSSVEYQRNLMTPSLRYDVLKRDNFKCKICGATAEMGATLQVDHIKPVSKGGKTEYGNLQTLCQTCNLGKSDKY